MHVIVRRSWMRNWADNEKRRGCAWYEEERNPPLGGDLDLSNYHSWLGYNASLCTYQALPAAGSASIDVVARNNREPFVPGRSD